MVNLVRYAEVMDLLDQVEGQAEALMANEIEMFATLKARYAEPVDGLFDDALCLQLMLRNVAIRKGHGVDPKAGFRQPIELTDKPTDQS